MDSHIVHPHDQEHNRDPQHLGTHQGKNLIILQMFVFCLSLIFFKCRFGFLSVNVSIFVRLVEGEDEDHHEKKSVLMKVKEKAKKIKNTLKKHGHGQDHQEGHIPDDHDLDEKDDEGGEDTKMHGATSKLLCA